MNKLLTIAFTSGLLAMTGPEPASAEPTTNAALPSRPANDYRAANFVVW